MAVQDVAAHASGRANVGTVTSALLDRVPGFIRFFLSRRFATFLVFGGLAAVVNLAVGRLLYASSGGAELLPYWLAVGLASAAGLLVNFGLNYTFNFQYRGRSAGAQLRTFVVVAMGGVALTALIASGVRSAAGWWALPAAIVVADVSLSIDFLAHFIAVGLVTFYSFVGHSLLSFNAGLRAVVLRLPVLANLQRRAS